MHTTFAGKRIILGVTGSIAAFKVAGWTSALAKEEALVDVVLTKSAQEFISALTFASLSGRRVFDDMFAAEREGVISHIQLAREADCIIIAPATAQTISRLANGQADDLLTTTVLAADVPVIVCPAMNVKMYEHPATQHNIQILRQYGYLVLDPGTGVMACKEEGAGRLPEWEEVGDFVLRAMSTKDLGGQRILVTAGPTQEPIDPARFISNRSSGKMGYAIARTAFRRGAEVTLISGPVSLDKPPGVRRIDVSSAQEMYEAVLSEYTSATAIIKSAAVADFSCASPHPEKVKKHEAPLTVELKHNQDILRELGLLRDPEKQLLVGFAAESRDIEQEGRKKLISKKLDLIAVNDISSSQAGFAVDTNQLTLIDQHRVVSLPHTSKMKTADLLWDYLLDKNFLKAV